MKYAVVKIGGSQYKVKEGEEFDVDKLLLKEGEQIDLGEVLLSVDDGQVKIGQPTVVGLSVKVKILSHFKGEKLRIARFKSKSRYRKVTGFRASLTKIKIESIGKVAEKRTEPKPEKETVEKKPITASTKPRSSERKVKSKKVSSFSDK